MLEDGEEEEKGVSEIKDIPGYARDIKGELESVEDIAENVHPTLGDRTYNKIMAFHGDAHDFAHKLVKAKEAEIKKARGQIVTDCETLQHEIKIISGEAYNTYASLQKTNPHKKALEDLFKSLREIRKKLSPIHNSLSA